MHHMFRRFFSENKLFVGYMNWASYVQKILLSSGSKISALAYTLLWPNPIEVHQYVHLLLIMEDCMQKSLVSTPHKNNSGMRVE